MVIVEVARDERTAETRADAEPKAERRAEAEQQAGDESRDERQRRRGGEAKFGRVACNCSGCRVGRSLESWRPGMRFFELLEVLYVLNV